MVDQQEKLVRTVVIREFRKGSSDEHQCYDLVKDYIMSFAFSSFVQCLLREVTFQTIVIMWALLFIVFGVPLMVCVFAGVPFVIILIFLLTYGVHYNKSVELANAFYKVTFVAEIVEPSLTMDYKKCEIQVLLDKSDALDFDPQLVGGRRRLVGTISAKAHESLSNSGWITRFAVDKSFPIESWAVIAEALVSKVIQHGAIEQWENIEVTATECQESVREVYLKLGFGIRQVYHKQVVGSSLRVMKCQLGIDINQYLNSREKNRVFNAY